jgi:hypothetical protein
VRKADLAKNHEDLDAALARYRAFMTKIIAAQRVVATAQEKRDIAESVMLRLCANWERFVDGHLVDCINRDPSKLSEYLGVTLKSHPDKATCQALLFGGSYLDFRSFGDLKGFSKKVLPKSSNPFLQVTPTQADRIDEVYRIRNYLTHYSDKARRSLMAMYKDEYQMSKFLEPGYFLLGYEGRRLWRYFDAFEAASSKMKEWCT